MINKPLKLNRYVIYGKNKITNGLSVLISPFLNNHIFSHYNYINMYTITIFTIYIDTITMDSSG